MARLTVLLVDREESRRKEVARGLAAFAYEVVTAASGEEGRRFAEGLTPDVVVVEAALVPAVVPPAGGGAALWIALATDEEAAAAASSPAVAVAGLTPGAIVGKLRTALLGKELGLAADRRLEALDGNLLAVPLLELLPKLQRQIVSGRILLEGGEVAVADGDVVAARASGARGAKAFVRLARSTFGAFRLLPGNPGVAREIHDDLLTVMALAMEDQARVQEAAAHLPHPESPLRLVVGPAFFATQFTPVQQAILAAAHGGGTIGEVVDRVAEPDGVVLSEIASLRDAGLVAFDEPGARVRVVTDSTADLPAALAQAHGIEVVPLSVLFGSEIYKDGVDLQPEAFYTMLQDRKHPEPRTAPPTRGEFAAVYRRVGERSDIVSLHISEKMSQTVVNARTAAGAEDGGSGRTGKAPEVVDGLQVSTGLGLLAVFAARLARRRLDAAEIRRRIEAIRGRIELLFVVDTLEYLARGGRIGQAQAWIGGLLGIKPILGVRGGEVVPVDRVRGGAAAQRRLVELLKERVDSARPLVVGIGHAAAPEWAARLRALLVEAFTIAELFENEIGPVVGTHVGPGCVGAAVFQPSEGELELLTPPA